MLTFTNPRLTATFTDWPLGGNKRGECRFAVETHPKKGHRICRVTTGKPKYSTYAGPSAIVDGSNGRTYLLQRIDIYGGVKVMRSDFMDATSDLGTNSSTFYRDSNPEQYNVLRQLVDKANEAPLTEAEIDRLADEEVARGLN